MADTMRAAVLHGVDDLRVQDVPRPTTPEPGQALVRLRSVGICGSDVHYFRRGRIGNFVVESPLILGHEAAGEVLEVGAGVTHLHPGQRVAIEPGFPDRTCRFCREGRYNLCPEVTFLATPPVDGAFTEVLAWPADCLHPLPDGVSLDEGAMVEPLSVGIHAIRRTGLRPGQSVAILGAGPIGLCTLAVALAAGATTAIITDSVSLRLQMAEQMGATHVLPVGPGNVDEVMAITGGLGVDVACECAGAVPALQAALRMTRSGGFVQLVGMPAETDPPVPVYELIGRELSVGGLFRYCNTYPAGLSLIARGAVDVKPLITHHFVLEQAPAAMAFVDDHRAEVIKAVVHP
jgi:L-iditol 2-dehydrogenase